MSSAHEYTIPRTTFSVDWGEKSTPWDLFHSLLNWGDSGQAIWYCSPAMPEVVKTMHGVWENTCVTRINTLKLLVPFSEWPTQMTQATWCSRVGKSSWDMSMDFYAAGEEDRPIAQMVTTMVSVDETLEKTKPLENPEEIKLWARPATLALDVWSSYPETRPADAFVLDATTRLVDTDALGHINNAKYVYLACEAVYKALCAGALHTSAKHTDPVHLYGSIDTVGLSYSGQLKAGEAYKALVWQQDDAIFCDFDSLAGDNMCSVTLVGKGLASL